MSIKKNEYCEKTNEINEIKLILERLVFNNEIVEESLKIKTKLNDVLNDLDSMINDIDTIKINKALIKKLDGKIESGAELRDLIIQASGYTKWSTKWNEELIDETTLKMIKDQFSVDFECSSIRKYTYIKPSKYQDDVSTITIIALPNYFIVGIYVNSRYEPNELEYRYQSDELLDKNELIKCIEVNT